MSLSISWFRRSDFSLKTLLTVATHARKRKPPAGDGVPSAPSPCRYRPAKKKFHCQVMLPGVEPKEVNIQVQGNTLTINGERRDFRETKEADYHHREITYGSFQRGLLLPEGVDKDRLSAEYRNGILEITAPISAAALPKKIEVKALPISRHATA
ncbi:MAG TPA: Hsp20/alpha crystallin family protein [Candidatus Polarisedimenticolia bacterium]|nr:Hsp20/alpha crystallin family protein [Candidatus Polarisedimenticolia bacterium]